MEINEKIKKIFNYIKNNNDKLKIRKQNILRKK